MYLPDNDKFLSFNPRICKRCDSFAVLILYKSHSFNPRICKRCDLLLAVLAMLPMCCFNPRICKRCD